jgi:hypothetical protein
MSVSMTSDALFKVGPKDVWLRQVFFVNTVIFKFSPRNELELINCLSVRRIVTQLDNY